MIITRYNVKKFISNHYVSIIIITSLLFMLIFPSGSIKFIAALIVLNGLIHLALLASILGFFESNVITVSNKDLARPVIYHIIKTAVITGILLYRECYYTAVMMIVLSITLELHRIILKREKEEGKF